MKHEEKIRHAALQSLDSRSKLNGLGQTIDLPNADTALPSVKSGMRLGRNVLFSPQLLESLHGRIDKGRRDMLIRIFGTVGCVQAGRA